MNVRFRFINVRIKQPLLKVKIMPMGYSFIYIDINK